MLRIPPAFVCQSFAGPAASDSVFQELAFSAAALRFPRSLQMQFQERCGQVAPSQ